MTMSNKQSGVVFVQQVGTGTCRSARGFNPADTFDHKKQWDHEKGGNALRSGSRYANELTPTTDCTCKYMLVKVSIASIKIITHSVVDKLKVHNF